MNRILSPAERSTLKARAHPLRPVVMIGTDGLSAAVLQEIDASLKAHELIKIKVDSDDPDERDDLMGTICANTGASAIQHIGKILVVFRERQDKSKNENGNRGRRNASQAGQNTGSTNAARRQGAKAGASTGGRAGGKGGKSGQVWTKVRSQKPRRNKPRKPAES